MFKINISTKDGKTFYLETETENLFGKSLKEKVEGKEITPDLEGYEFEITGASDKAGFPSLETVDGIALKRVLLTYGKGMKKRPRREGKKKQKSPKPKGLRLRKTMRGKVLSPAMAQVNLKVLKEGSKKLQELFPQQNQPKEKKAEEKPAEAVAQ